MFEFIKWVVCFFTRKEYIGSYAGASVYKKNNKLLFVFMNEDDASDFLSIVSGADTTPSVIDLMLKRRNL